ncbi:MAG: asparagine--tRNA ligase, partial [Gemmatimonadetes bacterium]|nr:asparagine--tRNA ligase [Gemmatimonadota bacterium]
LSHVETHSEAGEYPITPKEHGQSFLMDHRHLWLRSRMPHAILSIRSSVEFALRSFFDDEGFTLIDAPIFTPSACEGTSTLFQTDYFDKQAYLTQSGQLYMEAAAAAFGKVYCFGPTFRAEKSKTRRHLTEFWMLEPEMAWADIDDVMELAEKMIASVIGTVLERNALDLATLERDPAKLEAIRPPFPRITYAEALEVLAKQGKTLAWGDDFGGEDETIIANSFEKPVFVHRWPKEAKAFYMAPDPEDDRLVLGVDLIAPEGYGEIIGGGQRADSLSYLEEQIKAHDLPAEAFEWYTDLRRFGSVPHAGFGIGLERFVGWICGTHHVREVIPFPRTMNRLSP